MRTLTIVLLLTGAAFAQSMKFAAPCDSSKQVLSPAGDHLAVQCKNGSVHLLQLPGGRELRSETPNTRVATHEFSPDGRWLGLGFNDGTVEVWSATTDAEPVRWSAGKKPVELLKFSPDRQLVLVGNTLDANEVWEFSGAPVKLATLSSDFGSFTSAAFSSDGKTMATTGADTVVRFFDTTTWKQIRENRDLTLEPFAVQFTRDGKQLVIGGADGQLSVLDAATAKTLRKLPAETDPIDQIQVVNANQVVAIYTDLDGRKPPHLKLWDLIAGSSTPIQIEPTVTGGGIAAGKIWLVKANTQEIELSTGK
ncbi:MAG TPA: hypothetical protein VFP40_17365 [Terriglobales bacterium]|nr:hypothetical protein [Terriglobales bacterium]